MYKVKQYSAPLPQIFHIEVMFLDALYLGCYNASLRKDMLQKLGMCEFFNSSIHWRDSQEKINSKLLHILLNFDKKKSPYKKYN